MLPVPDAPVDPMRAARQEEARSRRPPCADVEWRPRSLRCPSLVPPHGFQITGPLLSDYRFQRLRPSAENPGFLGAHDLSEARLSGAPAVVVP